ncbi:unnamed protein product [Brassicogethes aeneus]|uniref:cysteine--tRNA ligase n=1 Tax=Brassicogethes aeneus TaxID=1431903 RepID=A0A9P0FIV1_BRAAE|nr:unnamed protein product [Brassicogethes aeneus]
MPLKFLQKSSSLLQNFNNKCRFKHNWIQPEGYDTGIKVYNCVTKSKVPLILKNKSFTKWYTCGPTVYDTSHIGHACCYTKLDIIQGILKKQFNVNLVTVMNITDIDDKIINKSIETNKSPKEIAKYYERDFWDDLNLLGISQPDIVLRVSDNINLIVNFIEQLMESKFAYQSEDSVYFDVSKYENYGKLQSIGEGTNTKIPNKRNTADFALWKGSKPNEPYWESPWGPGRPGWHIECSALASSTFGSEIDIHAGGMDLRFPHHENEETQSCAFHNNSQWVNYWMHTGHLHLKNAEKMSKSLKNTISIKDLLKTVDRDDFRMACTMSHYKSAMEYSEEFMQTAKNVLNLYKKFIVNCSEYNKGILKGELNSDILSSLVHNTAEDINKSLCNDFDTPGVINTLNHVVSTVNAMLHSTPAREGRNTEVAHLTALSNLVKKTLNSFNINLKESNNVIDNSFIDIMDVFNNFRQDVRNYGIVNKNKDILKFCDLARNQLNNYGVVVNDHGNMSSWSKM